jgi:hypothetical protein
MYENKASQPSADILSKMANVLGVSSDFLTNGSTEELATNTLSDKELLNQFKAIEKMSGSDKNIVKTLIEAFITKKRCIFPNLLYKHPGCSNPNAYC